MKKESILIENFGPLKHAEIPDLKQMTVLIGESGSGKSTILKVIALFRWIYKMLCIGTYLKKSGIRKSQFHLKFNSYLKNDSLIEYLHPDTRFVYTNGTLRLVYERGKLSGTKKLIPFDEISMEKISFISDKRGTIADIQQNDLSLKKRAFYLNETWEEYLKAVDSVTQMDIDYLDVRFECKKTKAGIKHRITSRDKEKVYEIGLAEASSGTQTSVPLSIIIEYYSKYYNLLESINKSILSYLSVSDDLVNFKASTNVKDFPYRRVSLCVEEPELSLFPSAQVGLMKFMANRCFYIDHEYEMGIMLTTHSPYILNYLNVLINDTHSESYIPADKLAVYRVYKGELQNLICYDEQEKPLVNSYDLSEEIETTYKQYIDIISE